MVQEAKHFCDAPKVMIQMPNEYTETKSTREGIDSIKRKL